MFNGLENLSEAELKKWIETSLAENKNILAAGYQGQTLVFKEGNNHLVIKVAHGKGLVKKIHILLLKHEHKVYQKLNGFPGIPDCYGMVDGQYLVIKYIDGSPIRNNRPNNESIYFNSLFEYIQTMHTMDVAHFDLKKKDNLLVAKNNTPCLIDFGVAIIKKPGFHPLNHYLFSLAQRFDYNAWIRHKYNNQLDHISHEDSVYYDKSLIEIVSYKVKRFYKDKILKMIRKH